MKPITANQFGYFIMAPHAERQRKLKEITAKEGGGHGYSHLRKCLEKLLQEHKSISHAQLEQYAKKVDTYAVSEQWRKRYKLCSRGFKRLVENTSGGTFYADHALNSKLSESPLWLNESLVGVKFTADVCVKFSSPRRPLACFIHYPFEFTPTEKGKKPDLQRAHIFLRVLQLALDAMDHEPKYEAAWIHASTGKLYTLTDTPELTQQIWEAEVKTVVAYLNSVAA